MGVKIVAGGQNGRWQRDPFDCAQGRLLHPVSRNRAISLSSSREILAAR